MVLHIETKLVKNGLTHGFAAYSGWYAQELFERGTEYAHATLAISNKRVSANLAHHAIECILKAWVAHEIKLTTHTDVKHFTNILKNSYRHGLAQLWSDFKKLQPNHGWMHHDSFVKELNRWEDLRYPYFGTYSAVVGVNARTTVKRNGYRSHIDFVLDQNEFRIFYNELIAKLAPYCGSPSGQYLLPVL